ncbi:TonB-dependent siderophore receptor [Marinobacter xestospongiae]|uniref:TonB-dependent siderophore receptor n=1 Tax=Marinobacter xestospongiae TaxID=994319 RepID=UPI0020044E18|nr:TonB-dependent siderophore receptor [Marinobacter xestospongiae]MCK7566417.1 TonB-dependent siderophore receptor [Marinobacter xestospongiae]
MPYSRDPFVPGLPRTRLGLMSIALVPAVLMTTGAQAAEGDAATQLQALEVVSTALKVDVPLVETPRPAAVVSEEELAERNVQSLDESFRYRAGVLSGLYGADNDTDWFRIRGFDNSTYQDGLRIYREGFYQWLPEPFGLERVELLKGPASILYGEAPPGGVINAISKRPTDEPQGLLQLQAGNREHRQLGVDQSGELSDQARYRIVGMYKYREGDLDRTENERFYVAPSLQFDLGEATTLTLLSSFQKDDAVPTNGFKLPYGTLQNTPYGKVDPSTNLSEPDYDQNNRTQASIGYELEHRFNDTWTGIQSLRYQRLDVDLQSTYALMVNPENDREAVRGLVYRDGRTRSWTVDSRLVGRFYSERTENTLLLGIDYQNLGTNGQEADPFPFGAPLDMFDPVYGNFTPVADADLLTRDIDKQQTGLYLQNQLRLDDRWVVLAGARYDHAETDNLNASSGAMQRSDDEAVSLSGGLMYLADNGLSPYLSYTESFQPLTRTDDDGRLYDPREGKQLEVGLKYAPRGFDGYLTAAAFDLEEENSLVTAPGGFQVQEGERRSRGFELEGVGYLTDQLQATLAYAYTDTERKNKASGDESRAALIPRHLASAWLDYQFQGPLDGLKLGGGVRYVGESVDGDTEVPSYTLMDLMASYAITPQWLAQLNVNNVADKEYVASCDYWCYYGESRSIIGSLSYRW